MLRVILDFLLVPALVTTALGAPVALLLAVGARWASRAPDDANSDAGATRPGASVSRQVLAGVLGLLATLLLIVAAAAGVVRLRWPWLRPLGWIAVACAWSLVWWGVARYRQHSLWTAGVLTALLWVLDAHVTERLLFE